MKYHFSFQKVLDVKEKEKEIAEQEYGTSKVRQLELEEQMNHLDSTMEKTFNQYNDVSRKTVRDILELQDEIQSIHHKKQQLENQFRSIHQEVEERHHLLLEKTKEAKMWNQWKEKSKAVFQKQLNQKEQEMLDEMAVLRYTRKV
ncbi:flagellar export protein FliJ [Neobacillus citreus]|uniref:Flagellar FliJ protein n=1 Tax=Neobacillus citreus TaxID=2833578 RepID=A0A942SUE2_9BACI|nr:flagellar export protein FliJ [Neobacillus citreus]MCH6266819.1 flagellar export protein FliJ [Neobacillus citreus]